MISSAQGSSPHNPRSWASFLENMEVVPHHPSLFRVCDMDSGLISHNLELYLEIMDASSYTAEERSIQHVWPPYSLDLSLKPKCLGYFEM